MTPKQIAAMNKQAAQIQKTSGKSGKDEIGSS
jgi:hypothetical protein